MFQEDRVAIPLALGQFQLLRRHRRTLLAIPNQDHSKAATGFHVLDVHQPPSTHDRDAVGDLLNLGQDMTGEDHGLPLLSCLLDQTQDQASRRRIQRRGRLIQDEDIDRVGEGLGQHQLLLHAGRVGSHASSSGPVS